MKNLLVFLVLLACAFARVDASGAEVVGVKVADSAKSGAAELVLNGAGLRSKLFFKVYVLGLYLPAKKATAAEVLAAPGPKRILIHMLRTVDAQEFGEALEKGINENHTEAEAKALAPRLAVLIGLMKEVKETKEGMEILLDWVPGAGTQVTIDGQPRGNPIPGEDFYRALLRIWVGEHPVSDDLKSALLGKAG